VGQGTISDRTKEHLGKSDKGIAMMRQRMESEMIAVEEGRDPKGIIRDPEQAKFVELPFIERKILTEGATLAEIREHPLFGAHLDTFMFQHGQPQEVWDEFREAMGLEKTVRPDRMSTL
jgi:5,5'-dehydrodivanillate O-demethylase